MQVKRLLLTSQNSNDFLMKNKNFKITQYRLSLVPIGIGKRFEKPLTHISLVLM